MAMLVCVVGSAREAGRFEKVPAEKSLIVLFLRLIDRGGHARTMSREARRNKIFVTSRTRQKIGFGVRTFYAVTHKIDDEPTDR